MGSGQVSGVLFACLLSFPSMRTSTRVAESGAVVMSGANFMVVLVRRRVSTGRFCSVLVAAYFMVV